MSVWIGFVIGLAVLLIIAVVRATGSLAPAVFIVVLAAAAIIIPLAIQDQHKWERWCVSQGGHVKEVDNVVSTINSNGKPGVGVSSTYYCLTADGRVLDIKS